MTQPTAQRRLAAILSADVVGYSRLMQADDRATLRTLTELRTLLSEKAAAWNGRVVNMAGDAILAEFASVVDAVQCAIDLQRELASRNAGLPESRRMQMRMGVNVGDVLVDANGIYGNGVNVAARLESLCPPGGVAVSDKVYEEVRDKLAVRFIDLGAHEVKNIARPIRMYALDTSGYGVEVRTKRFRISRRSGIAAAVAAAILATVLIAIVQIARKPSPLAGGDGARPFRSIAVLPLATDTASAEAQRLADQLSRNLTTAIARSVSDGVVASYGLVQQYGGKSRDPRVVGRDLNVRYVVDGTLRPAGDTYALDIETIDSLSGAHVWAYRATQSAPDLGKEVAKVSNGLRRALFEISRSEIASLPEPRRSAWQVVARTWDTGSSLADIDTSQKLYEEALRLDPDLDVALLGLGASLNARIQNEPENLERLVKRLDEVSARAVRVAPKNPRSWLQRSQALRWQGNWSGALAANDAAFQIDPFRARNFINRAELLMVTGRGEESLSLLQQASELDPGEARLATAYRCVALMLLARDADAVPACEATAVDSDFWTMTALTAAAHANLGNTKEAAFWKRKLLEANPKITIARMRAAPYSSHPEYLRQMEHLLAGLHRAGIPEQ